MQRSNAEIISKLALRASDELNSILIELLKGADAEKTAEYKKLLARSWAKSIPTSCAQFMSFIPSLHRTN